MAMLLSGRDPVLQVLRKQLEVCKVACREFTGAGFYTTFVVPDHVPRVEGNDSFNFGDVTAQLDGAAFGAGFVLFVKDGLIDFLEGYTYDGPWPEESNHFTLAYATGAQRQLEVLRKRWS